MFWFILISIVVVAIIIVVKKAADKAKAEQQERDRIERAQKAAAAEKARKAKFEVITDAEKQKLRAHGEAVLSTTLNAFGKALNGDAVAMLFMGITYQAKIKNPQKAFYWIEKSSKVGNSEATYWLGEFYASGYGVEQNKIRGVSIIMDAARKGNENAIKALKADGMSIAEMRSIGIPV